MVDGTPPREASERLTIFQVTFDLIVVLKIKMLNWIIFVGQVVKTKSERERLLLLAHNVRI
jgi:hypothetical protein